MSARYRYIEWDEHNIWKNEIKYGVTVVLSRDFPEQGLNRGDIGAVVHCYKAGNGFEVEFITGQGETVAVMTLNDNDARPMQSEEILHVRQLKAVPA